MHGGVSGVAKQSLPALGYALDHAARVTSALDRVERAVVALEDDPSLNAGWGSVLNRVGAVELDAGIADGATGRAAGVLGVTVRHPVSLARRVLDETPHVLVAGAGAMALASGMEALEGTTQEQWDRWSRARADGSLHAGAYGADEHVDTVGAVALDAAGRLAAAGSTGGVFGKLPGRVGDSAVFGAGTFASPAAAVVGTGVGELFLLSLASARVGRLIEDGAHPQQACEQVIELLGQRARVPAGLLALDERGRVGAAFRGGSWAVEGPEGPVAAAPLA